MKVNEGEVPQYYIEHSHEAIIDPLEHDRVQLEIGRRKALDRHYSSAHIFSSRVICGECGGFYGRKVWHSTDAYKNYIWQCNEKYRKQQKCRTPHLKEDELKRRFVYAYNQRAEIKEETLAACQLGIETICGLIDLDEQIRVVTDEISVLVEMSKQLIEENSRAVHDQDEYQRRHSALVNKYTEADNQLKALQEERSRRIDMSKSIEWFMESFSRQDGLLTEFDDSLFFSVCDVMTVYCDGKVVIRFRDGAEIETIPDPAKK